MKKIFIALLMLPVILLTHELSYSESFSKENPYIMRSPAALGMGNVAYSRDSAKYASFYNPASLAFVNSWSVDLLPFTLGASHYTMNSAKDLIYGFENITDVNNMIQFLRNMIGKYQQVEVNIFPAFTMKNFTIGVFNSSSSNFIAYNEAMPEMLVRIKSDTGIATSYAMQFLSDGSLSVGVTLKGFYRVNLTESYSSLDLLSMAEMNQSILESILKNKSGKDVSGYAILGSIGTIYTIPYQVLNPRIGLSFNDFGYTNFGSFVEKINPTLNISIGISPSISILDTNFSIDFTDILLANKQDKSFIKRFNLGAELGFWKKLYLRTGFYQGYITAGLGVDLWIVKANYAYYTEELGLYGGHIKDSRHLVEFIIGF